MKPTKQNQKKELRWILHHAKPSALGIFLLTAGCCLTSGITIAFALVMKQIIDSATGQNIPAFVQAVCLYLGLLLLRMLLVMGTNLLQEKLSFSLTRQIQESVYQTLLKMEYGRFSAYHTGTLLSHITTDVETIADIALSLLPGLLSLLVTLAGAAGLLIVWDPRFSAVLLLGGGAVFACTVLLRRKLKQLQRAVREENDKNWSFFQESLHSMMILRAFSAEGLMEQRLDDRMEHLWKARFKKAVFSNLCNRGFNLAVNCSYLLGLVWCSVGLLRGTMTYGTLSAVLELVLQLQSPVAQIGSYIPQYYSMCTSAERLMALENEPSEASRTLQQEEETCQTMQAEFAAIGARNLSFAYEKMPVYSHAELRIEKGETVAFMGRSGIGKSTFLKLLLALYSPSEGEIWLEQADGKRMPVSVHTRGLFAYVPQENGLLSGSIWECVALFKTAQQLTAEEKARVQRACRTACAEEFIQALPQGYNTVLGENGKGLSEGQMQRLAVARALYAEAPILLLDEATSALDEATEARLLANLKADAGQKTILIVTHRKAALALCDRIFEVEDGRFRQRAENAGEDEP